MIDKKKRKDAAVGKFIIKKKLIPYKDLEKEEESFLYSELRSKILITENKESYTIYFRGIVDEVRKGVYKFNIEKNSKEFYQELFKTKGVEKEYEKILSIIDGNHMDFAQYLSHAMEEFFLLGKYGRIQGFERWRLFFRWIIEKYLYR